MAFDLPTTAAPEWYVSRRIAASQPEAMRALGDALRADPLLLTLGPDFAIGRVEHLRLGETRGFSGRLRLGLVGAARIEVEVEPWSHTEAALGVRPLRRAPRARADRYFERALALLAILEASILERIVTPVPAEVRRAS